MPTIDPPTDPHKKRLSPYEATISARRMNQSQTVGPDGQPSNRSRPAPLGGESLPNHVDELDVNATSVTPAAMRATRRSAARRPPPGGARRSSGWGCLVRGLLFLVFAGVAFVLIGLALGLLGYYSIARTLPSVDDLRARSAQFETTRILDRNGNSLYEILDPNAGRRTYVPLNKISPALVAATIATEDKDFYTHPGFDPVAILRALWQNYTTGGTASGASTITQQLARALLLSPDERTERTYLRKAREVILAAEITRTYSKDEILELYLNEIYYGNLAYGIEAASETYFNTTADKLTLAQAAFLAGLPQAPSVYDVYANRDATMHRYQDVLTLMYTLSAERNCIRVSNSDQPVCLEAPAAVDAYTELLNFNFPQPDIVVRYPHWVTYVRAILEAQFDAQTIYRSGFVIYTTLDPGLQDVAQQLVSDQVAALADKHVTNGALVAIRPASGEILAMVGSADFYNEAISGQVNMAVSQTRQPGSSIKPLTYAAAFEKGWTPSTLIWDVPSEFPDGANPAYIPNNYDERFHGPVLARTALANSYNIPAVKALEFVGVYDDPSTPAKEGLIGMAEKLGVTSLTRNDYGLALTLGGGDVSLLEMTGAYAVFANQGRRIPPYAIAKIYDHQGNLIYEYQTPAGEQALRAEHAYLITSILSDNNARLPMFGANSVLNLPFAAAAKTGTTNDFRDNWTIGYTPDITVGVWVGNADYTPMEHTTGLTGAAPIWAAFMQSAEQQLTGGNATSFTRPNGIVDKVVCAISGAEPSEWCSSQRSEIFASDQPPLPSKKDLWQEAVIDTWTGLYASNACDEFTAKKLVMNVTDPWAKKWLRKDDAGRAWARDNGFDRPIYFVPERECKSSDPRPTLEFTELKDKDKIENDVLNILFIARGEGFEEVVLEVGRGVDPDNWEILFRTNQPINNPGDGFRWKLNDVKNGNYTLRLTMTNKDEGYAERKIVINIDIPEPTATPTQTPEPTNTPIPTDLPTSTETPTEIPTDTPTPTETPTP
jgi:penicillin-binding protein 1C